MKYTNTYNQNHKSEFRRRKRGKSRKTKIHFTEKSDNKTTK